MTKTPKLELPPKFSAEPIAIVGLGAIMPDANTIDEFWQNIITGRDSIQDVPKERWDPELFYDDDRDVPDKSYSKIGAFVKDFNLNPIEYRIPPNVLEQIDKVQQWALASAKEALEDANYDSEDFPSEKTAVIVGNSLGGEKSFEVSQRVYFPAIVRALRKTENFQKLSSDEQEALLKELEEKYKKNIPVINEDSMPGELANIVAGRIAATFNLRGKNMTSDAACASSLAAIDVAFKGLQAREFDAAVVGGSDRSMDPPTYVKFAKIGALSADGSFPFDERANGFVMGEGAGMMVLKRLSDAQKAGDKIYALITGVGSSSDGKGKGITAPNPIGQELAVKRALEAANITAQDIQLIEAHGTSTSVGDYVEISTAEKVFKEQGAKPQSVKIGSIKSQIGHLKSAAGAAGLLKAALSLHHKTYPPSINFETPNPKIDWESSPFVVSTHPEEWPKPANDVRRAGVSSFGFGGTNFHVIMEEYDPTKTYDTGDVIYGTMEQVGQVAGSELSYEAYVDRNRELTAEPVLVSGGSVDDVVEQLKTLPDQIAASTYFDDQTHPSLVEIVNSITFNPDDKVRVGLSVEDIQDLDQTVTIAEGALQDPKKREIARNRGIYVSEGIPEGKIAFMFPGQGSQYADMMADLAKKYQVVQDTLDEADEILSDMLDKPLSSYILSDGRDRKEVEEDLRQTEITQPAMLTADIALFRLFAQFNITPDMVAGHSLGEYGALVAAGVLSFADALKAVAIRGKAMSEVDAEDKGTMASISGSIADVEDVLEEVEGYAIAANKNSLSSTVISGSTPGIEEAVEKFKEKGMNAIPLSVSAAFHTKIVEPAAEPLSEFLDEIEFNKPLLPITSNVTGDFFPEDPEEIRALMKQQVGAAVEWTSQVQQMHDRGATAFFEVGPKRALSSFVSDILSDENIVSVVCNHPKKGGIRTFNDALAAAAALGIDLIRPDPRSEIFHVDYQLPHKGVTPIKARGQVTTEQQQLSSTATTQVDGGEIRYDHYQQFMEQMTEFMNSDAGKIKKLGFNLDQIVITGTGVGLPGKHKEVFAPDNVDRILRGDNLIEKLPRDQLEKQLEKNIRRLIKKSSGEAEFYSPSSYEDVIRLAGQQGKFDLVEEFGVKEGIASTYDIATSLAIASGLEALKDAGIPLVREYKKTSTGSYLPGDYVLPKELQEDTGIIFASAFPGFDSFAHEITSFKEHELKEQNRQQLTELYGEISRRVSGDAKDVLLDKIDRELQELDKEISGYTFNRKILLEVLSFGHAQFAQLIKAKGPNTQVNAACASTTQALGIANDWIRTGRAKRVIVISADNITSDGLFEWLGSGFLASGAASIKDKVEEAALPFDRRRGGMIIGMGAAGFMVESQAEAQRRGVTPIVELLGTHYSNSAYHGTRLDTQHVSAELQRFMDRVEAVHGINTRDVGRSLMFMSHETYTPRRGGSAAAEIRSLRETFGDVASQINITNTKGFTGHPMGAGIEDAIAIKSVEKGRIPPIANFKEPDPDLGNLKLSSGGKVQVDYALRLAAGFGSQISFALYKRMGSGNRFGSAYDAWIESLGGKPDDLYHHGKTLRLKDTGAPGKIAKSSRSTSTKPVRSPQRSPRPSSPPVRSPSPIAGASKSEIVDKIQDVMADMTGYPKNMLDPQLDIEADLGIDTVKMAESIGTLNEQFGVETDQNMNVADYNTIDKVADYYVGRVGSGGSSVSSTTPQQPSSSSTSSRRSSGASDADKDEIVSKIQNVMADMTGYPKDMLDPQLDIEADLGIDTVKMAESIGTLNDQFGVETQEGMNVADYNTIDKVADYYINRLQEDGSAPASTSDTGAITEPSRPAPQQVQRDESAFEKIVAILVELTGYPEVMIPNEYINFADDLGIDPDTKKTLNQKLADQFGLAVSELEGTETIQDVLALVAGDTPAKTKTKPQKKQKKKKKKSTSSPMMAQADVSEDVRNSVYGLIADNTGYPEMMIEESLDLLNDLGVDNTTKETIAAAISSQYGVDEDELNKAQTVHDLLSVLAGESLPELEEEEVEVEEAPEDISDEVAESAREAAAGGDTLQAITDIIAEKSGYPPEMLDPSLDLESELGIDTVKQAEIFGIAREKFGIPPIEGMQIAEYNTINKIADLIDSSSGQSTSSSTSRRDQAEEEEQEDTQPTFRYVLRENQVDATSDFDGEVVVLAEKDDVPNALSDLTSIDPTVDYQDLELEEGTNLVILNPETAVFDDMTDFFSFLKKNVDKLSKLVLAVKNLSSDASIYQLTPLEGSIGGMFKALAMEFSNITAKTVVYHKIGQVVNELGNEGVEIVYRDDKRYVVALSEEDLPEKVYSLPEDAVLLASGGAQGITHELVKSIATESSTLILLGRTEVRDDAAEIAELSDKEKENRKFELMKTMQEEGKQVTPVILEKEWSKIAKSATVYQSLKELEELGCEVIYQSVDVTDKESVAEGFEEIREKLDNRDITHFIHGAGIEISRATKSKKEDEFELVYSVKADGFENLLAELQLDMVELVVGFSSVAGRFGNATQVDYSAANEYLAKRCAQLNRDKTRAFVIDWSAWDEVGMATKGSTMQVLESQGVTPIPVDEGIKRFQAELAAGDEPEVVISGKLGALAGKVNWYDPDFFRGVMMDEFSGLELTSSRILSLSKDRYLDDHRIDDKAVLPGVMGMETMSEVSRAINGQSVSAMYDIEFSSPVKLPRDEDLEIITQAQKLGDMLKLDLKSKFIGPDGKQLGDLRQHFAAKTVCTPRLPGFPVMNKQDVDQFLDDVILDQEDIYETFFHGPSYQVISALSRLYDNGVVAQFNQPEKSMFEDEADLEINPLLLEAAFQTAGLHLLYQKKQMGLPAGVESIHLFETDATPALLRAYFVSSSEMYSTYNVEMIDANGDLIALMQNYQMIHIGNVDTQDLELSEEPSLIEIRQMIGGLSTDLVVVDTDCLENVSEEFIEQFLTITEQTRFSGIQAKKKRNEWLAGRIAAKLALAHYHLVGLQAIEIEKDENRSPYAVVSGEKTDVSITHSNGVAIAIAGELTVDLEKVESRAPSFIREAFSEDEIEEYDLLNQDDVTITRFWTIKEAHLKRMRIGLKTSLHGVSITQKNGTTATVESPQGSSVCHTSTTDAFVLTVAKPKDGH